MNTQPSSYDLTSSLRILYRRRRMIVTGTFIATVAVAVASLLWPQTWRAESHILVTTPKFKEQITLLSRPLDVLTYRSLLVDQSMLSTVLDRLRWLHESLYDVLENPTKKEILLENLDLQEGEIQPFLLIQRTNIPKLARVIYEDAEELHKPGEAINNLLDERVQRLRILGFMSAGEIQAVYELDDDELSDLTLFDLREMLRASVTKVKETNLETIYSQIIDVYGEFDTASSAQMITNVWVRSFLDRAEEIARNEILSRTGQVNRHGEELTSRLNQAYEKLRDLCANSGLQDLKAKLAAKRMLLYGVAETEAVWAEKLNELNLEDEDLPFLTEHLRKESLSQFQMQENFGEAILPRLIEVETEIAQLERLPVGMREENYQEHWNRQQTIREGLQDLATSLLSEIDELRKQVGAADTKMIAIQREIEQLENQAAAHERQLQQAAMLIGGMEEGQRFADVQGGTAVMPDKRVFPKRTMMTGVGMLVSFILLCCLAFFLEIWPKIAVENGAGRRE